jgi:alpha-L-fucosidase
MVSSLAKRPGELTVAEQAEGDSTGTNYFAQWQNAMGEWRQAFEAMAAMRPGGAGSWPQGDANVAEWRARMVAAIEDYQRKAQPYQDEMIEALRTLAASWPDAFRPMMDTVVASVEGGIEAERRLLEGIAEMAKRSA